MIIRGVTVQYVHVTRSRRTRLTVTQSAVTHVIITAGSYDSFILRLFNRSVRQKLWCHESSLVFSCLFSLAWLYKSGRNNKTQLLNCKNNELVYKQCVLMVFVLVFTRSPEETPGVKYVPNHPHFFVFKRF